MRLVALWAASQAAYHLSKKLPERPLLRIAHRGGAAYAPENTLDACRHGIRLGADYLETDVRQTCDGRLVLMHDSFLRRTTGRPGRVENTPYDPSLPTFDDYLELAREHDTRVFPEIKGRDLEEAVVEALHAHQMADRAIIPCFSARVLARLHHLAPNIPLCQLLYPWELYLRPLPQYITIVAPMAEALILNPWIVRQAQNRGLQVWPWFAALETPITIAYLKSLGVDGIIADNAAF